MNRILTTLSEDISISEVYLVKKVHHTLSKLRNHAERPDQEDLKEVCELINQKYQNNLNYVGQTGILNSTLIFEPTFTDKA